MISLSVRFLATSLLLVSLESHAVDNFDFEKLEPRGGGHSSEHSGNNNNDHDDVDHAFDDE